MSAAVDHRALFRGARERVLSLIAGPAGLPAKREGLAKLEAIADGDTVVALGALAADVEPELRVAIAETVDRLDGYRRFIRELESLDPEIRSRAARALGVLRYRAAVPALVARLDDPDASVREQAASALTRLADPRSEPALRRALSDDPSPDVRSACAQALGALGARDALADAADREDDPFVVVLIERALWRLDSL